MLFCIYRFIPVQIDKDSAMKEAENVSTTPMVFRVDPGLKEAFANAAKLSGSTASDLLRGFMADFTSRQVAKPAISEEERQRRQKAVKAGFANVALEGFKQSPQSIAHAQRFIDGEIDFDAWGAASYNDVHQGR